MSKAILNQLLAAREASTKGEWEISEDDIRTRADVRGGIICEAPLDWEESMKDWGANADFLLLSHTSLPAIAEWVEGLEAMLHNAAKGLAGNQTAHDAFWDAYGTQFPDGDGKEKQ